MDMPKDAFVIFGQGGVVMAVLPDEPGTYVFVADGVDINSAYWLEEYPEDFRSDWIMVNDQGQPDAGDQVTDDLPAIPETTPFIPLTIDLGVLSVGHDLIVA